MPLPLIPLAFTTSRLASHVSGRSPSLATQADGVGNISRAITVSRFGNRSPSKFPAVSSRLAIAEQVRGVGNI
jgi:hypothetical protein